MIDNNMGRVWANAPSGVRDAKVLSWIIVVILALALSVSFASPELFAKVGMPIVVSWIVLLLLYIWLIGAFKSGAKAAYYVQMALAFLGLLGFPIGTIIYLFILSKWFRPETRAWFGV